MVTISDEKNTLKDKVVDSALAFVTAMSSSFCVNGYPNKTYEALVQLRKDLNAYFEFKEKD